MRFCEYLRTTVLLLSSSSVALIVIAFGAVAREGDSLLMLMTLGWNAMAFGIGLWLGRRPEAMASIRTLLSRSRPEPIFPKIEPGLVLISRLWPVLLLALIAGFGSFWLPSLPAVTAGYGLLWALAWRKQAAAVAAIEERDAVHFWLVRSGAFRQPKLVRVPAM